MIVKSGLRSSSVLIMVFAAGTAIATRITAGISVQMISALVLCENWAASAPFDLRCMTSARIIQPNTKTAIAQQTQKISMCRS